ncbi:MAG: GAF domain-containing protein [Ahniella sp.]|nr:GAF domain-containing protein [Ahniella sp.]
MNKRPHTKPQLPEILADLARIATEDLGLRPMLQRVAEALAHFFQWEFVALASVNHDTRRFVCEALATTLPTDVQVGYSREFGSGVVGEVAVTGRPVLVSDARQHANFVHTLPGGLSELCPDPASWQVIAVLNLESTRIGTFDDSLDLLRTISEQIAGAIAAARRVEELTRRAELLEAVAEFTRQAMESDDLDALLAFVLRSLSTRFQTVESTVLLEGDLVGHLEVMAHLGASPHVTYRGKQWPISEGVVGRCFREGLPILIEDITRKPPMFR